LAETANKQGGKAAAPVLSAANSSALNSPGSNSSGSGSASQGVQVTPATASVTVDEGSKLQVPSLIGLTVRKVIEQAAAAGLEVQVSGSGTVREQAPAPGTMVAPGTKIVVRCGR
jgi:cell division protein FtsI (penicillin-binding protein 3)